MGKKETIANRQYTTEFKLEAVRLAESIGGNPAAERLGVPQSTMDHWVRQDKAGKLVEVASGTTPTRRPLTELEAENARLRRELASAKLDLEIVKKAAAYFAKESR